MKKKQLALKLRLSKETLRNLSDSELREVAAGATSRLLCQPSGYSECTPCASESCISGGSCTTGVGCC